MGRAIRHVLVVDNDTAVCDVLKLAVEAEGAYRASGATSIEDALRIVASDPPDAAVVDAIMAPGPGGLMFARQAIDFGVPVLIVTGEPEAQQQLTAVGCRYLPKPFRLEALGVELRALIDEATVQRARLSAQLDRLIANRDELRQAMSAARETVDRSRAFRASLKKRPDDE